MLMGGGSHADSFGDGITTSLAPGKNLVSNIDDAAQPPLDRNDGHKRTKRIKGCSLRPREAGQSRPILVIEDEPDLRRIATRFLSGAGYTVVTAGNGAEALHLLRVGLEPGLIMLDLMMPVMDGFQFRWHQMADPELARVPVIVCSASTDVEKAATQLGTAGYLVKPYHRGDLLDLVNAHRLGARPRASTA